MVSLLLWAASSSSGVPWGVDHVYILHYTPNTDRREALTKSMHEHDLEAEWITNFDRDELDPATIFRFYSQFRHVTESWDGDIYLTHKLSPSHISVRILLPLARTLCLLIISVTDSC
jgi:hypothetical protein